MELPVAFGGGVDTATHSRGERCQRIEVDIDRRRFHGALPGAEHRAAADDGRLEHAVVAGTDALVERFSHSTLQILLVNHINHANEIDETFRQAMAKLRRAGVTLLNQSVLLRGVNDNAQTLANLSNALFDAGVMPYYLHVLDKVQGAAHFMVSDDEARQIMRELLTLVSGYLVPKLAREIGGEPSKTPLDLQLRQQ